MKIETKSVHTFSSNETDEHLEGKKSAMTSRQADATRTWEKAWRMSYCFFLNNCPAQKTQNPPWTIIAHDENGQLLHSHGGNEK